MPSSQGENLSPICISEDERFKAPDVPLNAKEIMKILKHFSFLGVLHSKINFLFTSLSLLLIPKGFKLKWSEQTGFSSLNLVKSTSNILQKASFDLQKSVLEASIYKFNTLLNFVFGYKDILPQSDWLKGVKNYQFLFNMYSTKHQKKINNLSVGSKLLIFFPLISFHTTTPTFDIQFLLSTLPDVEASSSSSQNNPPTVGQPTVEISSLQMVPEESFPDLMLDEQISVEAPVLAESSLSENVFQISSVSSLVDLPIEMDSNLVSPLPLESAENPTPPSEMAETCLLYTSDAADE